MKKQFIFVLILISFGSCLHKKYLPDAKLEDGVYIFINTYYRYEDFPDENLGENGECEENFKEGGLRYGKIKNGYKDGAWLSGNAGFDENGNVIKKGHLWKEEYFKKGLRDSIYRKFNSKGEIIYETTFKNGTGLWKEFHSNGKIYFEAYTKDGYFTDTLKLYNDKGRLQGLRLYKKDSLIYRRDFDTNVVDTLENGKKVRITYKKYWMSSDLQIPYIFEKKYADKTIQFQYKDKLIYYKTDTLINNKKKEYTKAIKEDKLGEKTEESLFTYNQNLKEKSFEYHKLYRKGKLLKYRYFVKANKNEIAKIITIVYNDLGEIISKSILNINSSNAPYPQKGNITTYFEKGKIIYNSTEIIEKVEVEQYQPITNCFSQISYYDLSNQLFKKEFIKESKGHRVEGCSQGSETFEVDKYNILKTEYYENGKLIKTVESKTD